MTHNAQRPPQSIGRRPPKQCGGRIAHFFLCFCLIFEQPVFAQVARTLDISSYFNQARNAVIPQDKFRPLHLRYISYDSQSNDFKLLVDKGDFLKESPRHQVTTSPEKQEKALEGETQNLLRYFFIGLSLPNDKFWVNLRPDSPNNIIDDDLAMTDIGRIFLEADVQLKKDTANFTSPQTPEGKQYWDKLYKKAGELFGSENITIPTLTRPWIVPNEIIIRESPDNAYIYKATLKVMLEEDYLKSFQLSAVSQQQYNFKDPRLKELNEYSTQLIRELIIPKLTYQVNTSKRYASLRQVYYSLILAQWFKNKFSVPVNGLASKPVNSLTGKPDNPYSKLIDSRDLTNLTSKEPYDKEEYFKQYQKSFQDGEYNITEPVYTPYGQNIRRYLSGGIEGFMSSSAVTTMIPAKKDMPEIMNDAYAYPIKYLTNLEKQLWQRIEKELKAIKGVGGERKYYIHAQREIDDSVTYNGIEQATLLVRVKDNHQGYDLVKIGGLFFIDKEVYEDLEKDLELRAALKERAIVVSDLSDSTIGESEEKGGRMKLFTSATILLMLNSNIAGKCVIDSGSGDGLLALTALKLGASQAILIDNDEASLNKARQHFEANKFREGVHFWCIAGDLTNKDTLMPKIPEIKDSIVLISNIGTWPGDYGPVTNLTSVGLILNMIKDRNIRIDKIILGGYQSKEFIGHLPDGDIAQLKKYGFHTRPEQSYVGGCVSISAASSVVEVDGKSFQLARLEDSERKENRGINIAVDEDILYITNELEKKGVYFGFAGGIARKMLTGIKPSLRAADIDIVIRGYDKSKVRSVSEIIYFIEDMTRIKFKDTPLHVLNLGKDPDSEELFLYEDELYAKVDILRDFSLNRLIVHKDTSGWVVTSSAGGDYAEDIIQKRLSLIPAVSRHGTNRLLKLDTIFRCVRLMLEFPDMTVDDKSREEIKRIVDEMSEVESKTIREIVSNYLKKPKQNIHNIPENFLDMFARAKNPDTIIPLLKEIGGTRQTLFSILEALPATIPIHQIIKGF